ncbi:UDP-N-acetylmuramoyl-tripeptide--D-alanyl-D-alanine ligase [Vagococcus xieshaowenii]|uniref:UDP-N-acetylmuramoyl-tripeptide--D-alanyl-D-alanine ligase n=1 Tax=Vagococcus xieshaowenii TaxID=2562451 RepID=A0AAJ5ED70_9ENTE|nr:UDP-N-acetylmuramoyl-tripeptide--D-alanyl-D-alanine ligase [Vagococcus xieshaowenii]QCA28943.1 UDP-N-acetylmuramoyl-tripeptide--D-alanyl-D-alanine ligase [Vagococcus xieshaowenii]TFZ39245.1 UDP-N-acetylmuramoyl-tripeptide--D-alanyl-D-alanine ligase [Vagococcus xieshaowenii]
MLTIGEVVEVLEANLLLEKNLNTEITSVEFDTRKVGEGSLFIPLKGARDGHEFVTQAIEQGAIATLWEKGNPHTQPSGIIMIEVIDVLQALQDLAHYFVQKINPRVVGVTGSNGKTTTKDMLDSVLSQAFKTYKTQGNYNNDIGLPYTILHMPIDTELLVLEMGMNHKDEIRPLSLIAEPELAAITIIGESHIEYLGSRQGIAEAKMEIVEGLSLTGELIIPGNEPLLEPLVKGLSQTIVRFGQEGNEDISATIVESSKHSVTFTVSVFPGETFMIPIVGDYNVNNALIAIQAGRYFGLEVEQIKTGLAQLNLTQSRAEWVKAWNGADILNDAYNANPTAMSLVLETFSQIEVEEDGKRIVVLADMGELGEQSQQMHEEMLHAINFDAIHHIILYGEWMGYLADKMVTADTLVPIDYFNKAERLELVARLREIILPTDLVLFKGSNSMKLSEIIKEISEK